MDTGNYMANQMSDHIENTEHSQKDKQTFVEKEDHSREKVNNSNEKKMYFTSTDDNFCRELDDFDKEELEQLNYELIEADKDKEYEYIWCSHFGEAKEKTECRKSQCYSYKKEKGIGPCEHRGSLYWHGEKVNVKDLVD